MAREIIDITPPVLASVEGGDETAPATAVFPGDTPPARRILCEIAGGSNITLSTLVSTVHLGTHADGENHYVDGGRSIDEMSLDHYIGACEVVRAKVEAQPGGTRVGVADLETDIDAIDAERVLIATGTQPDKRIFPDDFAGLQPGLIDALAQRGVRTIGVDTPSVDVATSEDLPAHGACASWGIAIIEGLDLSAVEPGRYELIALPLRLVGFDASPVRAVLVRTTI